MKSKDITMKKVRGLSSAYPIVCDLKLLPNIDGTCITIQDDVGTSMTIKLSDLSDFQYNYEMSILDKIKAEIAEYKDDKVIHAERNEMIDIVLEIIDKYKGESEE